MQFTSTAKKAKYYRQDKTEEKGNGSLNVIHVLKPEITVARLMTEPSTLSEN